MEFIPEADNKKVSIPYYDDVAGKSNKGWSGHTTNKTIDNLESEITVALGRLGAIVTGFQRGHFIDENSGHKRQATRIHYTVSNSQGELWPGVIDIASLPVDKDRAQNDNSYQIKLKKALKMALFMALTAFQGAWNMKILSPGYSPLMPWMVTDTGETFSKRWESSLNTGGFAGLLPAPQAESDSNVVDGKFEETK